MKDTKDSTDKRHPIDVYVGQRIRERRNELNLTQTATSNAIGLKYQQIQKYESGENKIAASKLHDLSVVLNVPISWFFEGFDASPYEKAEGDLIPVFETKKLLSSYYGITDTGVRTKISDLLAEMARVEDSDNERGDPSTSGDEP